MGLCMLVDVADQGSGVCMTGSREWFRTTLEALCTILYTSCTLVEVAVVMHTAS